MNRQDRGDCSQIAKLLALKQRIMNSIPTHYMYNDYFHIDIVTSVKVAAFDGL